MTTSIRTIHSIAELKQVVTLEKRAQRKIGLVPTMGALHAGHLSLVSASLAHTDTTIVSIFVNPTQFAPHEDLANYPKTLERDLKLLASGANEPLTVPAISGPKRKRSGDNQQIIVFAPAAAEMYPPHFSTSIVPPSIAKTLEGEKRPTHFAGVATVVLKLLNLTQADVAYFGQKDFQQQLVVARMVQDLEVPTEIVICPIVREPDGLAMSSRNIYLSADQRQIALTLNRTLAAVEQHIREGQRDGFELIAEMRQMLIDGGVTSIDYASIADPQTLETMEVIHLPMVALLAAYVGETRLIDNVVIT